MESVLSKQNETSEHSLKQFTVQANTQDWHEETLNFLIDLYECSNEIRSAIDALHDEWPSKRLSALCYGGDVANIFDHVIDMESILEMFSEDIEAMVEYTPSPVRQAYNRYVEDRQNEDAA